jgi:hypothetical protein
MKATVTLLLVLCATCSLFAQNNSGTINFISLIGKNFDDVKLDQKEYSISENEVWRAERGWAVEATDGSFEMALAPDKTIRTIWLFPVNGSFRLHSYSSETTRDIIRTKHGKPTSHDDNIETILTEEAVSWDRYDSDTVAMHFEYTSRNLKLRLITLMDPEEAP